VERKIPAGISNCLTFPIRGSRSLNLVPNGSRGNGLPSRRGHGTRTRSAVVSSSRDPLSAKRVRARHALSSLGRTAPARAARGHVAGEVPVRGGVGRKLRRLANDMTARWRISQPSLSYGCEPAAQMLVRGHRRGLFSGEPRCPSAPGPYANALPAFSRCLTSPRRRRSSGRPARKRAPRPRPARVANRAGSP
jgi:hypothetical protein